jgi:hypothetical protein
VSTNYAHVFKGWVIQHPQTQDLYWAGDPLTGFLMAGNATIFFDTAEHAELVNKHVGGKVLPVDYGFTIEGENTEEPSKQFKMAVVLMGWVFLIIALIIVNITAAHAAEHRYRVYDNHGVRTGTVVQDHNRYRVYDRKGYRVGTVKEDNSPHARNTNARHPDWQEDGDE